MRAALFTSVALVLAGCAHAQSIKSYGGGSVIAVPTIPLTQTIAFGDHTLAGYGGSTLANTGGALTLNSLTNGSGASTHFKIDSNNDFVPTGTYGATGPTYSGPYTAVVSNAAGATSTVTVNITANTSTIKSHFNFATNPDTPGSFQLQKVLSLNTGVPLGGTIIVRDGGGEAGQTPGLNPLADTSQLAVGGTDNRYTIKPPNSGVYSSGAGRITIQCETYVPRATLDPNGNPIEGGNCQMAGINMFGGGSYTTGLPWDFSHVTFYHNHAPDPVTYPTSYLISGSMLIAGSLASGVGCYDCRFELGPNLNATIGVDFNLLGYQAKGGTITYSHFKGPFLEALQPFSSGGPLVITNNVAEGMAEDLMDISVSNGQSIVFTDNFGFNWLAKSANAVDGDAFFINGVTYVFDQAAANTQGHIPLGGNPGQSVINAACTINAGGTVSFFGTQTCVAGVNYPASETADANVSAAASYSSPVYKVTVTAKATGTGGNSITTPGTYNLHWMAASVLNGSYSMGWSNSTLTGGSAGVAATGALSLSPAHSDTFQYGTYGNSNTPADGLYGGQVGNGVDVERNISVRAVGSPNTDGTQQYFGNPLYGCCIMNALVQNNIFNQTAGNALFLESHYNPTIKANTALMDAGSTAWDPYKANGVTPEPTYDPYLAVSYTTGINPSALVPVGGTYFNGYGGGTFANNLVNTKASLAAQTTAGVTVNGTVLPGGTLTDSNNESLSQKGTPVADLIGYFSFLPHYAPAGCTAVSLASACWNTAFVNRAAVIAGMVPARGHLVSVTTTASSVTATLAGDVDGAAVVGLPLNGGTNMKIGDQISTCSANPCIVGSTLTLGVSATGTGTATYSTGAMNPDGSYNGALFPADNNGVISWNDGTVFNPAAVHTPAQ